MKLYTTHCPRCKVLEMKLKQKNIDFIEEENIQVMKEKGITSAPVLEYDGIMYDFPQAVRLVNSL